MKIFILTSCNDDEKILPDDALDMGAPYLTLKAARAAADEEATDVAEGEQVTLEWNGNNATRDGVLYRINEFNIYR